MDKKEKSENILNLITQFGLEFGESYNLVKSIKCVHGIPDGSIFGADFFSKFAEVDKKHHKYFTFAMIKPNAVKSKISKHIIEDLKKEGFEVVAFNYKIFTQEEAELFYEEHHGKDFFSNLIDFMTSGSVITLVLRSNDNSIALLREIMGPVSAIEDRELYPNTLRAKYADSMTENSIHGSDSLESFEREVKFF